MRSIAPGAKFSTSTSASRISFSMTSLPSGVLVLIASDRLLLLSIVKYRASTSGMSRSWWRVTSPPVVPLDLQHVGAEPGEHLGAGRAGLDAGEVDDLDSGQVAGWS